ARLPSPTSPATTTPFAAFAEARVARRLTLRRFAAIPLLPKPRIHHVPAGCLTFSSVSSRASPGRSHAAPPRSHFGSRYSELNGKNTETPTWACTLFVRLESLIQVDLSCGFAAILGFSRSSLKM